MNIAGISAVNSNTIMKQQPPATNPPSSQPNQGVKPEHHHHHSGGARDAGGLTQGKLTSSGSTPVLDTLV
jgi:hypothetical protein